MQIIDHWQGQNIEHQIVDVGQDVYVYRYRFPNIDDTWMNARLPDMCLVERIARLKNALTKGCPKYDERITEKGDRPSYCDEMLTGCGDRYKKSRLACWDKHDKGEK
jgi:hypothetical protein